MEKTKLCETCIYRNEDEYHKPCIVYSDDCRYYVKNTKKNRKQFMSNPLSFLFGMALGVIFVGIVALCIVDAHAVSVDEIAKERTIEVFPEPVTIVEISTLPHYISGLAKGEPIEIPVTKVYVQPSGHKLSAAAGRVNGPTNEETWYNLPMSKVVDTMRRKGFTEEEYPYYIREDGVKMLGDYVMVAADLDIHPRGVIVETSVGQGLVCDTGDFTEDIYDVATDW